MKKKILILLTIIWIGFIYYNSLLPGSYSSSQSMRFVDITKNILDYIGININIETLSLLIRKAAHVFEYFVLSILFTLIYIETNMSNRYKLTYSFLSTLLISIIDESIQSFVVGRYGTIIDVGIDMIGAILGIGLIILISLIRRKPRNN